MRAAAAVLLLPLLAAGYPGQLECGTDETTLLRVNTTIMGAATQLDTSNVSITIRHADGSIATDYIPGENLRVYVSDLPQARMLVIRASDGSGTLAGSAQELPQASRLVRKCAGQLYSAYNPGVATSFDFGWQMDCPAAPAPGTPAPAPGPATPAPAPPAKNQYVCSVCGHVYDAAADGGGKAFDDLPESFTCPVCGAPKSAFNKQADGTWAHRHALLSAGGDASITVGHAGGMGRSTQLVVATLKRRAGQAPRCTAPPPPEPPATPAPAPSPEPPTAFDCSGSPQVREYTMLIEDWVIDYLRPTKGARKSPYNINALARKAAALVNGSYPGMQIDACVNDTLQITVVNAMKSNEAIIHWHGIHDGGHPWADGAKGVTQAAIRAGKSMLYEFTAWPPGTHYWHSHMDAVLQAKGLRGPLVVHNREDPHAKLYDYEQTVVISDEWQNPEVCLSVEAYSNNEGNPVCAEIQHMSYNGQWGNGTSAYPFPTFDIYPGKCTRFRWINTASNAQDFIVEMGGHQMTLIATDSYDVHPVKVRSFKIAVGERIDVVVCGDQEPGYYRINATYDLACSLTAGYYQPFGFGTVNSCEFYAFLRYVNTGSALPAAPEYETCTRPYGGGCLPDGTGGGAAPKAVEGKAWDLTEQDSLFNTTTPLDSADYAGDEPEEPDHRIVVSGGNLAPEYKVGARPLESNRWYLDDHTQRRSWRQPLTPVLHTKGKCGADNVPIFDVPEKRADGKPVRTVELVINDLSPAAHVIHMHGMPFKLVGYADFHWCNATATECFFAPAGAQYANKYCPYDQAKGDPNGPNGLLGFYWGCTYNQTTDRDKLHLKGALIKDSFQIFRRSWAVLRFKATYPGMWLVHCHMEQHIPMGMSFALNVRPSEQPPIPAHVPREGPCPVWSDKNRTARERADEAQLATLQREVAELKGELRAAGH